MKSCCRLPLKNVLSNMGLSVALPLPESRCCTAAAGCGDALVDKTWGIPADASPVALSQCWGARLVHVRQMKPSQRLKLVEQRL
jgi:hypothetical protein